MHIPCNSHSILWWPSGRHDKLISIDEENIVFWGLDCSKKSAQVDFLPQLLSFSDFIWKNRQSGVEEDFPPLFRELGSGWGKMGNLRCQDVFVIICMMPIIMISVF